MRRRVGGGLDGMIGRRSANRDVRLRKVRFQ